MCQREHLTILTQSFLEELASSAGFEDLRFVVPAAETHWPRVFDKAVLAMESESTPEMPHTLLMEGRKVGGVA